MVPSLVRPLPVRPTVSSPAARPPSTLSSTRHSSVSCPPATESSGNGQSYTQPRRRRSSSSTTSKHSHSTPPSPSSLVLHSHTLDEPPHDYSALALEELLSILSCPLTTGSPPPILLPPSRSTSRSSNGLGRNGSLSHSGQRRRSSSIALIRAGSPDAPGLLYSPPSRALTRNPFHRHAATAASFLPSHTPRHASSFPYPSTTAAGAMTMPVTPTMGSHSALRVILGADAEREFGERERRDGGEGGLLGDGVREGGREKAIERGEEIGEVLPLSGGGVGMQQEQEQGSDDSTPLASTSDSTPTSAA